MEKQQQATGANPVLTERMLAELRSEGISAYNITYRQYRVMYDFPREAFMEQLRIQGSIVMASMREDGKFEYNDETTRIAEQLYLYTTGSDKFDGNLNKGIALVGPIGCGKTVIMTGYIKFLNEIRRLSEYGNAHEWREIPKEIGGGYKLETAPSLYRKYNPEAIENLIGGKMLIDELGREPKITKIYGSEASPLVEILFERHRRGAITHVISNLSLARLSEPDMYGPVLGDRLKQMFNFIEMKGKSRRV